MRKNKGASVGIEKTNLQKGNIALEKGDSSSATEFYRKAEKDLPLLSSYVRFNLAYAEYKNNKISLSQLKESLDFPISRKLIRKTSEIVVYSVLVGDYESIKEPKNKDSEVRYVLFTDNPNVQSDVWEVVFFDTLGFNPRRASRLPKLLPHRYLPYHDVSVYLDSSLTLIADDIGLLVEESLPVGVDLAAYPHYARTCIFDEVEQCIKDRKADDSIAKSFSARLQAEGFPKNYGLLENAFIIRRNNRSVQGLNEAWFQEFSSGPERDQFYLMYILWKRGNSWHAIGNASQFRNSPYVEFKAHTGNPEPFMALPTSVKPKINWVTGGEPSKGWAYENNAKRLIEYMPEFDHVINGSSIGDCAVYFDALIYKNAPQTSSRKILRLGGMSPVKRSYGDDPSDIAAGLSEFDAVVPLSHGLNRLARFSSVPASLIPNALDTSIFSPKSTESFGGKFKIGFAANCKTSVDREIKGLHLAEEAARELGLEFIALEKAKSQIFHNDMVQSFYHQIDCLVHPVAAGKEGCSNVVMEALACGVPVITTSDCGYHGEMLTDGVNVLFCERRVGDIKTKLEKLIRDLDLRARLSKGAVSFARKHHDIREVSNRFKYLVSEVLNNESGRTKFRPKLKIAMLTTTFWPKCSGMELMVHNLASALSEMGNHVTLFAPTHGSDYEEIKHVYELVRIKMDSSSLHYAYSDRHQSGAYDAFYVQGAYAAATMANQIKSEFGVPIVLRTHGEDIQVDREIGYGLRLNPKKDLIIRSNLKRADVNVSISLHVQKQLVSLTESTDNRIIPNGVDLNRFGLKKSDILRKKFGLKTTTKVLLTVGRNIQAKSFHLAVEALAEIRKSYSDVVLIHVGKEGNGKNLLEIAKELGVSDVFYQYGEVSYFEMPEVYSAADIFVFPSKLETFGNVTVEAMAAGLPCIEFDYGANQDKILHGSTGYIVPYGDVFGMAAAIGELLSDDKKRIRFSEAGRTYVEREFSWQAVSRKYHNAFLSKAGLSDRQLSRPPLKIAFVADKMIRIKAGGGEKSLTNLLNAMARRGHEVYLIIKEKGVASDEKPFYPLHGNVRICNILGWLNGEPPKVTKRKEDALEATIQMISPDVVVGFFLPEFGFIARGVEKLDVPLLLSHRNDPKQKLVNVTERYPKRLPHIEYASRRAQAFTVQMDPYIDLLPKEAVSKAVVIPNSVPPVPDAMLAKPDVVVERNVILSVARLVKAKHQDLMIRAFARIADKYPDWDIHIYGDGPLQEEIEALIESYKLYDRVFLMGTTQNVMPAFRDAKLYAFPSLYEGFSRALSEAMMHGLPSVVIDSCICSKTFIGDSGGGVVARDDETSFADGLERLMKDPGARKRLGRKAQKYISQFHPEKVYDLWEKQIYRTCAMRQIDK